jgi:hypothetical protein
LVFQQILFVFGMKYHGGQDYNLEERIFDIWLGSPVVTSQNLKIPVTSQILFIFGVEYLGLGV